MGERKAKAGLVERLLDDVQGAVVRGIGTQHRIVPHEGKLLHADPLHRFFRRVDVVLAHPAVDVRVDAIIGLLVQGKQECGVISLLYQYLTIGDGGR